jgi:hypothetical protein
VRQLPEQFQYNKINDSILISLVLTGRLSKKLPPEIETSAQKTKIAELEYFPHFLA